MSSYQNILVNSIVITVSADGLAPWGARPSAGTEMTKFAYRINTRLALEGLIWGHRFRRPGSTRRDFLLFGLLGWREPLGGGTWDYHWFIAQHISYPIFQIHLAAPQPSIWIRNEVSFSAFLICMYIRIYSIGIEGIFQQKYWIVFSVSQFWLPLDTPFCYAPDKLWKCI